MSVLESLKIAKIGGRGDIEISSEQLYNDLTVNSSIVSDQRYYTLKA